MAALMENPNPHIDIAGRVAAAKAACLAPATRKTYASAWNNWARWAEANGVQCLPAAPADIQAWLAALDAQGLKPGTLRTYRAALAWHHSHLGADNPAHHPDVRAVLAGLNRIAAREGRTTRQAQPLRQHHINQITLTAHKPRRNRPGGRLETAEQARTRGDLDIAMITVAYDAALRASELLALEWADIEPSKFRPGGRVRIRRSKTDQNGNGAYQPISESAMDALRRIRPPDAQPHHRVFPISYTTLNRRINAAAQAADIDPTGITTHSPRVGLAQDLAASSAPMPALMLAGRWTNPGTAHRYIQRLAADHTPLAHYHQSRDRVSDKPNILRLLAEKLPRLRALAIRLQPIAANTARQAQPVVSYSMRSLVKDLAAQLATFSPEMGALEGQGRSRSTGWPRLITLRRLDRSASTVTSAAGSPSTTSTSAAIPGARVPTSPSMRRAMAPLAVAQAMA